MTKKAQLILQHILGCLAFLSLPIIAYPNFDSFDNPFLDERFPRVMYKQILLLLFFYVNYYYFLPYFYFKKQYIKLFVIVMLTLAFILILGDTMGSVSPNFNEHLEKNEPIKQEESSNRPPLNYEQRLPNYFLNQNEQSDPNKRPNGVQLNRTEYTIIQFCFIFIISIFFKNTKRLDNLNKEKIKTELSYLKAQINPHFLFNTLNSLYALTLEKSDKAPNAVLKLSGLMRYVVTDSAQEFVPLEKEINYLNDYIELQKLRMDDTVKFLYTVTGSMLGEKITPLILIPFIENAFKYGINPEKNCEIRISIFIENANLELKVSNLIVVQSTLDDALKSEKGIASCLRRLQFTYPNKHSLDLKNDGTKYTVLLKMQLQ